jgi:hypothetical protein
MKNTLFLVLISVGILNGCGTKDNGPSVKTETPAKATVDAGLVVDTTFLQTSGTLEFGNKLYFSKNGSVTKLGCKMATLGNFRVSLWDFNTSDLIVATTINVTDTTKFIYNSISPTPVTATTRYVLSINNCIAGVGKNFYLMIKKPAALDIYPFTSGSVTYEDLRYATSTTSTFPATLNGSQNYFAGIPDLQFEYTE